MKILNLFRKELKLPDGSFVIEGVPFFSQRVDDANYKQEGFSSLKEAVYWSERICGIACVKMVVKAFMPEKDVRLNDLLDRGLEAVAYREDVGWIHQGLIDLARLFGLNGGRKSVGENIEKIGEYVINHKVVIASVTVGFEAGKEYKKEDGSYYKMQKGGHLVVVFGVEVENGKVKNLLLHHPSSWQSYEWHHHKISREDFLGSFSKKGNIIYLGR
mgnify:CR=1 FL=1